MAKSPSNHHALAATVTLAAVDPTPAASPSALRRFRGPREAPTRWRGASATAGNWAAPGGELGQLGGLSLDGFCHENMMIGAAERTRLGVLLDLTKKHGDCDLYVILKDCLKGTSTTNIVLDPQTHGLYCIFSSQFWDKWICIAGWYGIQHPSRNTFICSPFLYIWQSMCLKFQITNRCII